MMLVQFLAIGLVVLIIIKTTSDFKKKKITLKVFIFWILIWIAIMMVAGMPQITIPLSKILGVGRGIDVEVYFSILFIFFILFKIFSKMEKIEREITKITQYLSLKEPKEK
jgi:hypothetical protein